MPRVKKLDLGMTALDELFMNDKERAENKLPKIFDIPLSEIDDFPDHPYRVLDDEDTKIKQFGISIWCDASLKIRTIREMMSTPLS